MQQKDFIRFVAGRSRMVDGWAGSFKLLLQIDLLRRKMTSEPEFTVEYPEFTLQQFRDEYPEFSTIPDEIIQLNIAKSFRLVSPVWWRDLFKDAVLLLCAHEICLLQQVAILSQIQSSAIRDKSSYQSLNLNRDSEYYSLSQYGLKLLALKKQKPRVGFTW